MATWKAVILELVLYTILLSIYFFFVLYYLGDWFKDLYDHNRILFAAVALLIMIGQTVGLQAISSLLVRMVSGKDS